MSTILGLWAILAGVARADPNPLCLGTCADGATCGDSSDCGGDSCTFPDACLPGLAPLIEAVVPEEPNALNAHDEGWQCGYLTCVAGPDALSFSGAKITQVATRDFSLEPGRTWLVRAMLGADAGAYGYVEVVGTDVYAVSPFVSDAPAPVPVTLTVALPEAHTGDLTLQLHADGTGSLHLSDIVVYDIADYGVWIRFAAPGAPTRTRFEDTYVLRHGIPADDSHGYYPRACVGPVVDTCIDPALTETVADPGTFSPWIEVSAMFDDGWRASHAWDVTDATTGAPLTGATVQVQLAWAPDPAAVLWDDTRTLAGATVALVLPDGVPEPLGLLTDRGYLVDGPLSDLPALLADPAWTPAEPPVRYFTGSPLGRIDLFDEPSALDDTIELFGAIGFNRRSYLTDTPSADLQARAAALGMTKDLLHGEDILAPWNFSTTDLDLAALRATADANVADPAFAAVAADFPARPEDLFVILGDEIPGLQLAGPQYTQGFHDFLAAQGVLPADLGVAALTDVPPLASVRWTEVDALQPDPVANPEAARRFWWQLRWWNEATALAYRQVRDAIEQQPDWGAPYPMSFNAGTPFSPHYFTYPHGIEFQTMARAGAVTAYFGEGFLLFNDMCRAPQMSWYADFAAGQARPWGLPQHSYVHAHRGDQVAKALTLASRGHRYFDWYMYGPYDLSTGDGSGGLGALSTDWLTRVSAADDALAKAEPWLFDAVRAPAPVAILAAQSDPVWTDLGASSESDAGWHLAWTQAHLPVDFIVEEQLAAELAGRSVLLVDREHLSAAAWDVVAAWVEDGGMLILGRGLAGRDEFGQPVPERADWLGVTVGPVRFGKVDPARVTWAGSDIELTTYWAGLTGGVPLATYQNGAPAVVEVAHGKGRAVVVGFDLGAQFLKPITEDCFSIVPPGAEVFPEGWSDAIRVAAGSLASAVVRDVDADDPRVEVVRLQRADGGAIVVVPYANEPVTVTITASDLPAEVTDALTGATLPVSGGALTLTLDGATVLGWTDGAAEPGDTDDTDAPADTDGATEPPATDEDDVPAADEEAKGCGCDTPGTPGGGLAVALVLLAARRRRG